MTAFILFALIAALPLLYFPLLLRKFGRVDGGLDALSSTNRLEHAALFRQLEALQGLYVELRMTRSLPPTRGWAASPDFLLEVVQHALHAQPRTVVECSSGTSTLVLARCMQLIGSGHVYSLEHDAAYAAATRLLLERHGLQDFATVLVAPLRGLELGERLWQWYAHEVLPEVAIDLLVIDGPPKDTGLQARYPAGPVLFSRLAPGGTVFLDDARRADEVAILDRWRLEFPGLSQQLLHCEKGCAVLRKTSSS